MAELTVFDFTLTLADAPRRPLTTADAH